MFWRTGSGISRLNSDRRWDFGSPQYTWDQNTINGMMSFKFTGQKEVQNHFSSPKNQGHHLLGLKGSTVGWVIAMRSNNKLFSNVLWNLEKIVLGNPKQTMRNVKQQCLTIVWRCNTPYFSRNNKTYGQILMGYSLSPPHSPDLLTSDYHLFTSHTLEEYVNTWLYD